MTIYHFVIQIFELVQNLILRVYYIKNIYFSVIILRHYDSAVVTGLGFTIRLLGFGVNLYLIIIIVLTFAEVAVILHGWVRQFREMHISP